MADTVKAHIIPIHENIGYCKACHHAVDSVLYKGKMELYCTFCSEFLFYHNVVFY